MGKIRQLFGMQPDEPEETRMEQPRSPWTATEPDVTTQRRPNPWAPAPGKEEIVDSGSYERLVPAAGDGDVVRDFGARQDWENGDNDPEDGPTRLGDPVPVSDSGVHYLGAPGLSPQPEGSGTGGADDAGERCEHCGGRIPGDHELLTEVLGWIAPSGADFVHAFYGRLFELAPELRPLFPDDIQIQEEKLLSAIVSLLRLFKAGEQEMEQLNSALARFGRSHTRFDPAATIEEYAVVKAALFGVAGEMLADQLTARHVGALTRAYEYAAGMMLAAQATAKLKGEGRRRRTV